MRSAHRALRLLVHLCLAVGLAGAALAAGEDDFLARGAVVDRARNAKAGINASEIVTLRDGTTAGRAVFKPTGGSSRPAALRILARVRAATLTAREVAASELAIALGLPYVPRTIEREIEGQRGSLQLFVEDARRSRDLAAPGRALDRAAAEKVRVFDYLIGNSDRTSKNLMVRESGSTFLPVAIDNGNSFPRAPTPRFVWPIAWIAQHTGPLLPETRAFIERIDPAEVARVLQRTGIERDAAVHTLRRLARLKRDPSFLEVPGGRAAALRMGLRIARAGRSRSQGLRRIERDAMDALVVDAYGPARARFGIIASAGIHGGIPGSGPNLGTEAGFAWRTDPASGRRRLILYGSGGGSILFWGRKAVSSTLQLKPTIERKITAAGLTVARNHPIFGDRVAISPPLLSFYASRSGGLGLSVDVPPLFSVFGLGFPIVRNEFSLYVSHPRLARISNRFLDSTDRLAARAKKKLAPLKAKLTPLASKLSRGANRFRPRRAPATRW